MNTFQNKEFFVGNTSAYFLRKNSNKLWSLAKEIRAQLGDKKYLLDNYLSMFFEAANSELAQDTANRGFDKFSELYSICYKIYDKKPFDEENEFYNKVKKIMDKSPLPYQEKQTKIYIYCVKLSNDFTEYVTEKFMRRIDDNLRKDMDFSGFKGYYSEICDLICEEKMEELNLLLKNNFIIAPFLKTFFQAIKNQVLFCLIHRDKETSKQVFQLILDEKNNVLEDMKVENNHEPIIDRKVFEKVKNEIKKRSKNPPKSRKQHLFTGKIKCGICGANYKYKINGKKPVCMLTRGLHGLIPKTVMNFQPCLQKFFRL